MLDWIFEGIANWVASVMTQIMDAISGVFLDALGTDMTAMEEYFPFAVSAYTVIQYTAWAVLFLVVVWQLFRAFSGPLSETEEPLALLARGAIFAILIGYAKPIFSLVLDIARAPYTALMEETMDPGDFTFAGIQQTLTNGLATIVSVATVVGLILLIIFMIALAWNYFKLLLETVERYVLVGVLCYTSPLAYSMGASKATSRVFQSWCRMVGSQLLLLVLNVWFLRAFDSSVGQFIANGGALSSGQGSVFLWLFCALALLKIAQRCDSYIIMDGTYYTYLYIRKNGFPQQVRGGWMSSLINAGEGVDVDLHLHREIRGKTIDRVAQRIRLNRTKLRELQDTSTDYEELAGSIQAGYYIKQGLSSRNEDLFYMSVLITISAPTYEELQWRKQQMSDLMKSMDIQVGDCLFQQEAALRSTMPFLYLDPGLERKSKRNVLTSGAASTYMFTSFELSDDNGILLGLNRHNNSLCIVDPFNTKVNKNANFTICGTSGAGKTFTMQVMALRLRMRGVQCYIIAPLKGHEFKRACHKIGGTYIKLAPGSSACINVMEIRPTLTPEMELIDELDYNDIDSMLAKKIQQLMIFFSLLIPDMNNEEEQMLDEALVKTYAKFGITHDNNSIYVDQSRGEIKTMPILGDLYEILKENPLTTRLATIVSRFVTGSAQSFNRQTNVNLDNKYVVLDISELKGKLLPVGMMIALDYVWDQVKADRTRRKMVFIDEIWKLIGGAANKQAAEFCLEIFKIIRGYGGGALAATQDLSDFFGLEDGRYGRAILNNSKTKIILNLEPDEAEYVKDVLKLTRTEIRSITQFERGEALISSNSNKVPVIIKASREEQQMITTDRAELEAMLNELKAVADIAESGSNGSSAGLTGGMEGKDAED